LKNVGNQTLDGPHSREKNKINQSINKCTLKNAGLFQRMFESNMHKTNHWFK